MMNQTLANMGIAITRPNDQAKKLSHLITQAGGTPILFPLIAIAPLSDYRQFESVINNISDYDWVIFISSNAVQNGMPTLVKQGLPAHLKFAAIGPVTAAELTTHGVKQVLIPSNDKKDKVRFDSESLLAQPEMRMMQGQRVMIVRGAGGRELLADTLKARGATVTFAECYQRVNPQTDISPLTQAFAQKNLQAIVVTSSEAMRHLLDLALDLPEDSHWLKQITLCVNHARIAELPLQMGLNVAVANAPGDEAMLHCLIENLINQKTGLRS